ncbi:MAG: integrase core domain-containing protein, partial [Ignavibacteriales bacterium]
TGIKLFVLPPKSPKLNGCVERVQRTHTEEFYEVNDCPWTVPELNKELSYWNYIYNCVRPQLRQIGATRCPSPRVCGLLRPNALIHRILGYKTPLQFLKDKGIIHTNYPSTLSHMY